MGSLRVNKVIYSGKKYSFESEYFSKNIILIEGDNGTGKSTLCNLIYFALGGRVSEFLPDSSHKHREITSDTDNYVELYISLSEENYLIRRYISENDITVTPYSNEICLDEEENNEFLPVLLTEKTAFYPVNRNRTNPYIFSDWILEKLEISVVELYQGYQSFKINFSDLMRLIYHDQQPDPELIYKKLDIKTNYISESELLRKAIFELLVGKSFSEFYAAIEKVKKADKEKSIAKSLVDEYKTLAENIRGAVEFKNESFLREDIKNKEEQLEKLQTARKAFKRNRDATVLDQGIEDLKNNRISAELQLGDLQESLLTLYDERYNLVSVKSDTLRELGQIQKVIHTHDQLNLFSSDTCPYCLASVQRAKGHCVCGASIEEEQYERFFYTSQEYNEILKVKTKSLSTIHLAISGCNEEIDEKKQKKQTLEENLVKLKEKLRSLLDRVDQNIDIETINDIDDKILEVREVIAHCYRMLDLETKLAKLQSDFEDKRDLASKYELERKGLEIEAQIDIRSKIDKLSKIYNRFMVDTLADCRSARIKLTDYMPSINDGEYREASSKVSIRLMYYLSLLKLSLQEADVAFPRFLIVDTPETAGIELENLLNCMNQFKELETLGKDYQVIMATGLDKYPELFKDNRVLYMPTKADALLKLRD